MTDSGNLGTYVHSLLFPADHERLEARARELAALTGEAPSLSQAFIGMMNDLDLARALRSPAPNPEGKPTERLGVWLQEAEAERFDQIKASLSEAAGRPVGKSGTIRFIVRNA